MNNSHVAPSKADIQFLLPKCFTNANRKIFFYKTVKRCCHQIADNMCVRFIHTKFFVEIGFVVKGIMSKENRDGSRLVSIDPF
jgi:hypothetical protein